MCLTRGCILDYGYFHDHKNTTQQIRIHMSGRFIIEGEWSGYVSGQRRIVHRTVHEKAFKKLRAWAEKTHAIQYSDGTSLTIRVRDAKPRERVSVINGYSSLIRDCAFYDVDSVDGITTARQNAKSKNATKAH